MSPRNRPRQYFILLNGRVGGAKTKAVLFLAIFLILGLILTIQNNGSGSTTSHERQKETNVAEHEVQKETAMKFTVDEQRKAVLINKYRTLFEHRARFSNGRILAPLESGLETKTKNQTFACPLAGKDSQRNEETCYSPLIMFLPAISDTPGIPSIGSYVPLCGTIGKFKVYPNSTNCNNEFTSIMDTLAEQDPELVQYLGTAPPQQHDLLDTPIEVSEFCYTDDYGDHHLYCNMLK